MKGESMLLLVLPLFCFMTDAVSAKFNTCPDYRLMAQQQSDSHDGIDIICRPRQHTPTTCTGLDCNGFAKYDIKASKRLPTLHSEEADFCTGFDFDQCKRSVNVYVDIPKSETSFNHTFTVSDSMVIPHLVFDLHLAKIQLVMNVTLTPISDNGLSMDVMIRARLTIFRRVMWPDDQKSVFHRVKLYPRCNDLDRSVVHNVERSKCQPMKDITRPPTAPPGQTALPLLSTGMSCDMTFNNTCDPVTEMCHYKYVCVCKIGLILHNHKCVPAGATTKSVGQLNSARVTQTKKLPHSLANVPKADASKSKTVVIISTSVVAGVIAMVIIISVLVVVLRRRRASQYQGRQLVLSTDDDDNDII